MAFPIVQEGMWPDSTEVELQLGLVMPGVDGGCKGQVDNGPCW